MSPQKRGSRKLRRALLGGTALAGAALLAATASPLVGQSSAGYSDSVYTLAEGVSVPPTNALAAVVPSVALDTMQVLDAAGNLWIWGYYGNTGPGTSSAGQGGGREGIDYSTGVAFNEHKPNQFKAMSGITAMASSAYANYAVDENGNLFGWGQNNGSLYMFGNNFNGTGRVVPAGTTPENVTTNWAEAIIDTDVVSVASVEYGAAYTKKDGTIWTVGDNNLAQRGQGSSGGNGAAALRVATQVKTWPGGVQPHISVVYSGYEGYYAVDDDNQVFFWGRSYRDGAGSSSANLTAAGCRTIGAPTRDMRCETPVLLKEVTALAQAEGGVKSLGGGYSHGHLLTTEGNLYSWGSEENNYSGNDAVSDTSLNGTLPTLKATGVTSASARFGSTQYITEDGTAWAYGNRLWGGVFSLNYGQRTPTNNAHATGKVWDPAQESSGLKALFIGGNKDSASLVLEDGTILSWGENGGGAACGGYTYAQCKDKSGNTASVTATGTTNGLYVWQPAVIAGIQNVGQYQTVSLNSNPFTGSAVMSGQTISYSAIARNPFSDPADYTLEADLSAAIGDVDIVADSVWVTVGDADPVRGTFTNGKLGWSGTVPARSQVTVAFDVVVKSGTPGGAKLNAKVTLGVGGGTGDSDAVTHITTTNPDDLVNCDSCSAP
ncbi:hypothetical protein D3228_08990 [Leucobacter luti]|nr:hypothetical protein [Leucobacter luti]